MVISLAITRGDGGKVMIKPIYYKRHYTFNDGASLKLGERTLIMGILNVTPDSFSDGGQYTGLEAALQRVSQMVEEGVDIVDIGGESTRPGFTPISTEEEQARVIPVIRAIKAQYPKLVLSIDTYKAATAEAALAAGVHIINDIWCLQYEEQMAHVVAKYGCPVILNHNRKNRIYKDVVQDVCEDLLASVAIARDAGIADSHIWLDPGIGFAKDYEQNLDVHAQLYKLNLLGYPVLLGTSRKKFIRQTLDQDVLEISEGSLASNIVGITQGCQIVRVHDVGAMKKAALMTDALVYRHVN